MLEAGRKYAADRDHHVPARPIWRRSAAAPRRTSLSGSTMPRWTAAGRFPASPMRAPARMTPAASNGGARACWAAAPITGDASPCATARMISSRRRRDGLGFDWPIGYEDVAPYYDKVEMLIGVYGSNEGLENTPDSPPGCLLPPPKPLVSDYLVRAAREAPGHSGHPGPPGRADAGARSPTNAGPAASRQYQGPANSRRGHARAHGLPVGDALRLRLRGARQLSVDHRASAAGARRPATSTY